MASDGPARPWNRLAIAAAALGGLALVFWLVAGLAAVIVGYVALVRVNASDGRQRGAGLALAGLALGGIGLAMQVVWFFVVIVTTMQPYQARTIDANHLRQIGLALQAFHDNNEKLFPPAVSPLGTLPPEDRLSWMVLQLPYLMQVKGGKASFTDLAAKLDLAAGYAADVNAPARVPLRPYRSDVAPANTEATSYVGLAGIGPDAALLPATDPRAGFFGYERRVGLDDLTAGSKHTLAVVESTRGGPWARGGPGTAPFVPATDDKLFGPEAPFGGLHAEGLHLLFVDGHVEFRRNDMPPDLFRLLARIHRPD
jgi:prepilin-type processing-associated H-X9-DG protein